MTKLPLASVHEGQVFGPYEFVVSAEMVEDYLQAVGDDGHDYYFGLDSAPPVAMAAWSLGRLLQEVEVPATLLHRSESLEVKGGIGIGQSVIVDTRITQRAERAGGLIININFGIRVVGEEDYGISADTTVFVFPPVAPGTKIDPGKPKFSQGGLTSKTDSHLLSVPMIEAYAAASWDNNPIHLDDAYAASSPIGERIAHGMLLLAQIQTHLTEISDGRWLSWGSLSANFHTPGRPGDWMFAGSKRKGELEGDLENLFVECLIDQQGSEEKEMVALIRGTASVPVTNHEPAKDD